MDGEKKKRKMEDADKEENEDETIEKFFALIRSSREVRERMAGAGGHKPHAAAAAAAVWKPTFRLEDFFEGVPPAPAVEKAAGAGPSTEAGKQASAGKSGDKGLDLNLSL